MSSWRFLLDSQILQGKSQRDAVMKKGFFQEDPQLGKVFVLFAAVPLVVAIMVGCGGGNRANGMECQL